MSRVRDFNNAVWLVNEESIDDRVVVSHSQILNNATYENIRDGVRDIAQRKGIRMDATELLGNFDPSPILPSLQLRWDVEEVGDGTRLNEAVLIHKRVLLLFTLGILLIGLGVSSNSWVVIAIGMVPIAITYAPIAIFISGSHSVIEEFVERSPEYRTNSPLLLPSVFLALIMLTGFLFNGGLRSTGTVLACFALSFLLLFRYETFIKISNKYDPTSMLPCPTTEYIITALISATPCTLALLFYMRSSRLSKYFLPLPAALSIIAYYTIKYMPMESIASFKQGQRNIKNRNIALAALIIAVASSLGLIGTAIFVVYAFLLQPGSLLANAPLVGFIVFPTSLFIFGILYQIKDSIFTYVTVFKDSKPVTEGNQSFLEQNLSNSFYEIRLVERNDGFASSYSTGKKHYIFLSERLLNELTRREVHAIIAHEEGHLRYGDSFISFLAPFIASLLLTGRNVFFASLSFRQREFRADQYAAQKSGVRNLKSAIKRQRNLNLRDWGNSPTRRNGKVPRLLNPLKKRFKVFLTMFYGRFALSSAHPTVDERLTALETQTTS